MRKYRNDASSTIRIEYGIELHAGLSQFAETEAAAADVLAVNEALMQQHQIRLSLRAPELKTRATLRFAEYNVDKVIRSAYRAAEIEDGGRRGKISMALFPNGLSPVTRPSGRAQSKPTKELLERITLTKTSGIEAYRDVWQAKLEGVLANLESAIAMHDAARSNYDDAFKAEMALRDAHMEMVDKVMGLVRAAFPRDREVQDVIFPVVADDGAKKPNPPEDTEKAPVSAGTA